MRNKFLGALLAIGLAFAGTVIGSARADAAPAVCSRVQTGPSTYKLLFDPNGVVKGDVTSVRSGKFELMERPNGTWTGLVGTLTRPRPYFHIVVKSDAKLFSERRFSAWYYCPPAQP